ncbi:Crp/Fnr family transcriptional regulator [Sulfitobacter sp. S190]|uniref:Crp/Fnr family transcriptional regulator n=1 Tax=Sulfitobacter sp. S190 TaxID=2867022 RepID=UPI0021A55A69|nr:Crp/Fnr family transcriptional regulator [Sulfitobacter sp. S190]UWR21248.1 Crp/Fnr family transcriptional regulator [Sulfitobacter sp. S190]
MDVKKHSLPRISQSALSVRLSNFATLGQQEETFLQKAQTTSKRYKKGECLVRRGDRQNNLFMLQSGFAVMKSYSRGNGERILQTYFPGDIIGLAEMGSQQATHHVSMQKDGMLSTMSKTSFWQKLEELPRLAALLRAISCLDLLALRYHFSCLSSMDASSNLKHFLLQLRARQNVHKLGLGDKFEVPFSQVEIGQAIGLTPIYVNKLLRLFRDEGSLEIERPYYTLMKRQAWERETEFRDAYTNVDLSWFNERNSKECAYSDEIIDRVPIYSHQKKFIQDRPQSIL